MKMFSKKTIPLGMVISGIMGVLLMGCSMQVRTLKKVDTAMGTMVSQTLYVEGEGEELQKEILSCIDELEQEVLSWRLSGTEIYHINENAGNENGVEASGELIEMLLACLEVSDASGGAFDITIGDVVLLWDIDGWAGAEDTTGFPLPKESEIQAALRDTGYEKISVEDGKVVLPEKFRLDMGAVGKGIALDEIRELLEQKENVKGAVISVGGSILTYGSKPDGSAWNVGVVNPLNPSENVGILKLTGQWCVSTSGDYERYVEVEGERYHHILNPDTGKPADSGVRGITILTKDGLYSDALSTACFVLGVQKGLELAERFQAEVLFVLENGEMVMSDGMKAFFVSDNGQ